jgi:hypothetical protein
MQELVGQWPVSGCRFPVLAKAGWSRDRHAATGDGPVVTAESSDSPYSLAFLGILVILGISSTQ